MQRAAPSLREAVQEWEQYRARDRWRRLSSAPPPPPPPPDGDAAAAAEQRAAVDALAAAVHASFAARPRETAAAILGRLSDLDRVHLLLALQATTSREALRRLDTEYVDALYKGVDGRPGAGAAGRATGADLAASGLTRGQVASAVAYQRMLQRFSSFSGSPPGARALCAVALASGLPFVGFGFVDNVIMITAGEQIDALLGARLGITTLASAGLGNSVADMVGVGATQHIKESARKLSWAQPPRLSTLQQAMPSVRAAKMGGAVLGVLIGCLLGMAPLGVMEPGFWRKPHHRGGGG